MSSLLVLIEQYEVLAQKLVEGELTDELESELMNLDIKVPQKVEGYAKILERLEIESEAFKIKASQYKKAADSIENVRERIKDRLKYVMNSLKTDELFGTETRFKLSPTKQKLEIDILSIPNEYKKSTILIDADKDKIRKDLESGKEVKGASLQPSFSLRSYVIKSR